MQHCLILGCCGWYVIRYFMCSAATTRNALGDCTFFVLPTQFVVRCALPSKTAVSSAIKFLTVYSRLKNPDERQRESGSVVALAGGRAFPKLLLAASTRFSGSHLHPPCCLPCYYFVFLSKREWDAIQICPKAV